MPPKEAIKGSLNLAAAGSGSTGRGRRLAGALRADISRPRIVNFIYLSNTVQAFVDDFINHEKYNNLS
jgi:hypothetical protein